MFLFENNMDFYLFTCKYVTYLFGFTKIVSNFPVKHEKSYHFVQKF